MDRALPSGGRGQRFKSSQGRKSSLIFLKKGGNYEIFSGWSYGVGGGNNRVDDVAKARRIFKQCEGLAMFSDPISTALLITAAIIVVMLLLVK